MNLKGVRGEGSADCYQSITGEATILELLLGYWASVIRGVKVIMRRGYYGCQPP
jgi:hypothetical protein